MKKAKYEYNPIKEELFLLTNKKNKTLVTAYYSYGNIVCFDLNERFVENWQSGFFEEKKGKFEKVGTIIRPRWDRYELEWVLKKRQIVMNNFPKELESKKKKNG